MDTTDPNSRKPSIPEKESAQTVLNRFLKENGILLGTQSGKIETTNSGQIIISAPVVIAVYADDIKKQNAN